MGVTTQFDMVGGTTRYGMFEDFVGKWTGAIAGPVTGVTENSGTVAIKAAQEDGLFELTTGTSSGNDSMLVTDLNYKVSNGPIVMEAGVQLTSLANVQLFVGFTDLMTIHTPISIASGVALTLGATANAVGFVFSSAATNTANFYVAGDKAGAAVGPTLTTGFPLVASTFQALRVEIDRLGHAYFFINGNQVGTGTLNSSTGQTSLLNSVATTALLTPCVDVTTLTTAAKTCYVDYLYVQKGRQTQQKYRGEGN